MGRARCREGGHDALRRIPRLLRGDLPNVCGAREDKLHKLVCWSAVRRDGYDERDRSWNLLLEEPGIPSDFLGALDQPHRRDAQRRRVRPHEAERTESLREGPAL